MNKFSILLVFGLIALAWLTFLLCEGWSRVFAYIPASAAVFYAWQDVQAERKATILRFGDMVWTMSDFVRGWLITGRTGSGKTAAAIVRILAQLFARVPNWGGLCIDDKGLFWEVLGKIADDHKATDRLVLLQVKPDSAGDDWQPECTYNLLGDERIPASAYAKVIVDVGASVGGGGGKDFFKTQAMIHLGKGIEALRLAEAYVTLTNLYEFLATKKLMKETLDRIAEKADAAGDEVIQHFNEAFLNQPPEQLGGVKSTIFNFLHHFTHPDLATVFSPEGEPTFSFDKLDAGQIVCVSMPNKFQTERRYINTFLKLAFYAHALRRFDKDAKYRANCNLLVLVADEAQQIVTAAESGMSDHNVIDKIREARATAIFATQSTTSFIPALGNQDKANVLLLNLSNRVYFTVADDPAADLAAKHIGRRTVKKRVRTVGGGRPTTTISDNDEYRIKPQVLRAMRKFEAIVCHCEKGFRRLRLLPTNYTS